MELVRVDTQQAYEELWRRITTLALAPGALLDEQALAAELQVSQTAVREALKLLAHDDLVLITPRHGLHVAEISRADLEQLSEMRLSLEGLCARLAARRATSDDLAVLEALRREQAAIPATDSRRLFDLDHRFHQALARSAHNKYLARSLERLFGLSQRLWRLGLALPHLDFLPAAVEDHLRLLDAIQAGDADQAEQIMRRHVQEFYDKVRLVLENAAE